MKRKIFIIEDYEIEKQNEVQQLISRMVQEGDINLLLCLKYYQTPLTSKRIDSIANVIKAIGKEQEFVVDIILETDQWKNVKKLRKKLNQYAISVELRVTEGLKAKHILQYKNKLLLEKLSLPCHDYITFCQTFHNWKEAGLSIDAVDYELTHKEYLDFFEIWIRDPKATWFVPFENMISCMLTGISSGQCEHSSCMGKYLYLDKDNNVYFCAKKKENTQMYSLAEAASSPLYNEIYNKALAVVIDKRNQCMENCQLFNLCRGGCSLSDVSSEKCNEYTQKVAQMSKFIMEEIGNAFANIENPCIRQLYLSLIAYGFRFE